MIWSLNQQPELKSFSKLERMQWIYKLHRKHSRLTLLYLAAFGLSLSVVTYTYIQLPKTATCEFIAMLLGVVIWQAQYLWIINKIAYPLCKKMIKTD